MAFASEVLGLIPADRPAVRTFFTAHLEAGEVSDGTFHFLRNPACFILALSLIVGFVRAFHDVLGKVRDMGADLVVAAGLNHESVGLPCAQMNVANRDSAATSLQHGR